MVQHCFVFCTSLLTDLNDSIIHEQQQDNELQRRDRTGLVIHCHYLQEQMNIMNQDTIVDHFYYFVVLILCVQGGSSRLGQVRSG